MAMKKGFSLVEVLTVLFIASLISLPFTRMFTFGRRGSIENKEHIIAYNLAREKIEEVQSLPFELIKSDFDNFRDIYRDLPQYYEYFGSKARFTEKFSDVFTQSQINSEDYREIWPKFKDLYQKTFLREYSEYDDEMNLYRRIMEVDDQVYASHPPKLKKVTVWVYDRKGRRLAELVTLFGKHK